MMPDTRTVLAMLALLLSPLAATVAIAQVPAAESRDEISGRETFRTYCVVCHGTSGRGDGPLASSLSRKPSDLGELAGRNAGVFPSDMVFKIIDGRQPVRGHGGPDMPVWADVFMKTREGGGPEAVRQTITSLVSFIEGFQVRPIR
jgi:mono/diheme cytochrome c family protein